MGTPVVNVTLINIRRTDGERHRTLDMVPETSFAGNYLNQPRTQYQF